MIPHLIEAASKPTFPFSTVVPLFIHYPKRQVFIRWATDKSNKAGVFLACRRERLATLSTIFTFYAIRGCFGLVDQVWIKNIEFVPLNNFWRRILVVVMGLVILVPFIAHLYAIEIARFSRSILTRPLRLCVGDLFLACKYLFVLLNPSCHFSLVQRCCIMR